MNEIIFIKIIGLVFLFLILALFCMSETTIVGISESYLKQLKSKKPKLSKYISFLQNFSDEAVTAMVIGLNLAVVGISVISSSIISDLNFERNDIKATVILPAAAIVITLVFGNIFPKSFARYNAEKAAPNLLPFIVLFSSIFRPFAKTLSKIANFIIRLFLSKNKKESRLVKAEEIDFLLSNEMTSPLTDDSREIAGNIMDFSDMRVSQVMTLRSEIFAIDITKDKDEIVASIIDSQYSRVPVYKNHLGNIVGIIYSKDLALAWRNSDIIILEDLIRPAYFVPESAKVNQVLKEFKMGRRHSAIVVDEFGTAVGIVSIEDLLEEIVGEVLDEYDIDEKKIITYIGADGQEYLIMAKESVLNVNDYIKINIPDGDYSTINGWVLSLVGKIPKNGEKIRWQNYEIEIKDADEKKINRIILRCIIK
ncbi:MAG: hemolysin family protein [Elusimicrobiota bacterium]|jgi:CBS domain containing-hemolysin-like protein|nr:hemolysin family protein [Elusimicrobiota bacterium]